MKALDEGERDDQKEWISTVVPLRDVPLYLKEGFETVGESFGVNVRIHPCGEAIVVEKITVRKRIKSGE